MANKINYTISLATLSDLQQINHERNEFHMHSPEFLPHGCEGSTAWVAKEGNKIIGFIEINFGGDQNGKNAEIHAFSMRVGYEKRGFGSKLYTRALDFAKQNGAKTFHVWPRIDSENSRLDSLSFYRRRGHKGSALDLIKTISQKRRPRIGLAPQNIIRPEARLKRRARK